jgi:phenylacetate-CoA ligase
LDWHAVLIRTVVGPLWARWEGSPFLRHYRELRKTQYDDPNGIRARQWGALRAMVRHAYESVPFYRRRLDDCGLTPESIRGFEDYLQVPVLTKAEIRAHGRELLSNGYPAESLNIKKTSGSTGVALEILIDEASLQWKRACTLRSDEWSGWRWGERVAALWGDPDYLKHGWRGRFRNAFLDRATWADTLRLDEPTLRHFAQALVRKPPSLIYGHAHSVFLFAEYLRGVSLPAIRPKGIITTAMVLLDRQRQVIEEVFACPVTNRYGCEEVSLIACECERHRGMHLNADGVYVEFLRDGRPVDPGQPGSVVVTDLSNRGMPILRYQIGDVGVPSDRACPCGRGLPLLERLEGREADYVVTRAGRLISGISLTDHFGAQVPGVTQLQIVQEEVDRFRYRIVRGPGFGATSLQRLRELTAERFGADVAYECEYVDHIPQEPSGKYRFCISRVPNPFSHPTEIMAADADTGR